MRWTGLCALAGGLLVLSCASGLTQGGTNELESLRAAITDLIETFGDRYPRGPELLARLEAIEAASEAGSEEIGALKREALLEHNPLIDFDRLLLIRRRAGRYRESDGHSIGLPRGDCHKAIFKDELRRSNGQRNYLYGWDNEIAGLSPVHPDGELQTLYRPDDGLHLGDIDVHWDGDRFIFAMPSGPNYTFRIHEMNVNGSGLRLISTDEEPDIDNFDGCYLPNGDIIFNSTATWHGVPCYHGIQESCGLFRMDADGGNVRMLCHDQDISYHPVVMSDGQILFSRWNYIGNTHYLYRTLMAMNPDGTGQRAVLNSNEWWPPFWAYPCPVPGSTSLVAAIACGHHGVSRRGHLYLLDLNRSGRAAEAVVQQIPFRDRPVRPIVKDALIDANVRPMFTSPYALSDKYFLVSGRFGRDEPFGIYLVDVSDNVVPVYREPGYHLLEPVPVRPRLRPPIIPDTVAPGKSAVVYLHNVYAGRGLAGVPRGAVKRLRVVAFHFGYPGGSVGNGRVGIGGPWEPVRVLGTVPVEDDGSAMFEVPPMTPLAVQPLDAEGKAVQVMRSWFTARPGEAVSCVGCHEPLRETPTPGYGDRAATRPPARIEAWHGPVRGLDFERDVQPALDRYCVSCHSPGQSAASLDLRNDRLTGNYRGRDLVWRERPDREVMQWLQTNQEGKIKFTQAYENLLPYIWRVNVEDPVPLHVPGEYYADSSWLIQMLRKGHYGVQLDPEAWDRLITWIDTNGPCHGTWGEAFPIPRNGHQRRMALWGKYDGPEYDPESIPDLNPARSPVAPSPLPPKEPYPSIDGWPFDAAEARRKQGLHEPSRAEVHLGDGATMSLVWVPPGRFVMGEADAPVGDSLGERPLTDVALPQGFWMSAGEVTNRQYRRYSPGHDSGDFTKRYRSADGQGLPLDGHEQPAVRVSWIEARAFCRWLSDQTGARFRLPAEDEWEWACRAGTRTQHSYGDDGADFSTRANMADGTLGDGETLATKGSVVGGLKRADASFPDGKGAGCILCAMDVTDGVKQSADVGRYQPNLWGLFDMHGNAAEWTLTTFAGYPYDRDDGRNDARTDLDGSRLKVVRGGSYRDMPRWCRSATRQAYPFWVRSQYIGFRVVCETDPIPAAVLAGD